MSIFISAHQLTHSFSGRTLFENLNFSIHSGERIGLIGPNGAGKSTLLKILSGQLRADEGDLSLQKNLRIGFLEQVPQFSKNSTVRSTLEEGLLHPEAWESHALVDELISKFFLDGSQGVTAEDLIQKLSGGWKKRVALARELVKQPDLLLLDEPTNHLDVESILWLEDFLKNAPFATVTITHDRVFLQKISNRILELDRRNPNGLLSVKGDYADYVELKAETLKAQEQQELVLKNTLRRETEWLRRGPKARTTKQQARIDRAEVLQQEVSAIGERTQSRTVSLDFQSSERQPKKLISAKSISKRYPSQLLFSELDVQLGVGTRLGLLGANGCGKSTLIRVLLGLESPDTGTIELSDGLSVAYFEQNREALQPNDTILQSICPEGDYVNYRGSFIHARGYLERFLFSAAQMNLKIRQLSGGEQSRLLLARLMLQPANLLVLDEPTNDLDLETLNILQECLIEFKGAVLLVTHDRYFLDQVATQILAFPPTQNNPSRLLTYFSDLSQWENWFTEQQRTTHKKSALNQAPKDILPDSNPAKKKKLSFKEQLEFDTMEEKIHLAEAELETLTHTSQLPENTSHAHRLTELTQQMSAVQLKIDQLYARWAELESKIK